MGLGGLYELVDCAGPARGFMGRIEVRSRH